MGKTEMNKEGIDTLNVALRKTWSVKKIYAVLRNQRRIINRQQKEIDEMKKWIEKKEALNLPF